MHIIYSLKLFATIFIYPNLIFFFIFQKKKMN